MFSSNAAARNFHQYRSSERCWPNSGLGAVSIPCRESSLPLCFAFLSEHSCLLGWESPAREGWGTARATAGAQYQALHSAGTYDCARNGREHQALVRLESILLSVNFRLYSWLYTLCFTTDLSTCFNCHRFWDTFSGAHNLLSGHCRYRCTPTSHARGHSPTSPAEVLSVKV